MDKKYLISGVKDGITYFYKDLDAHNRIDELGEDLNEELSKISSNLNNVNSAVSQNTAFRTSSDTRLTSVETTVTRLTNSIAFLKEQGKKESVFFEVTQAPAGTLVDYNCKEIRIMIPEMTNEDWEAYTPTILKDTLKTPAASSYKYIAFVAYAPDNAETYKEIISYEYPESVKEESGKIPFGNEDEYEYAGIDGHDRKFSIYYFPVARKVDDNWEYLGTDSTEDFMGWYYTIEWYGSDERAVKADTVRVNLATDKNFRYIEPTHEHSIWAKYLDLNEKYEKILEKLSLLENTSIGVNLGNSADPHPLIEFNYNQEYNGYTFTRYNGRKEILEIPEKVEGIDVIGCSFSSSSTFRTGSTTKIILPKTIKFIDERSFEMASHIHDIYIPLPENSIPGAPWGSTTLIVHWNYNGII